MQRFRRGLRTNLQRPVRREWGAGALYQGVQRVARQPAHIAPHVRLVVIAFVGR